MIQVIIEPNKNRTKGILKFRVYSNENTFKHVTKYQVINKLNDNQKELIDTYDRVVALLKSNYNDKVKFSIDIRKKTLSNSLTEKDFAMLEVKKAIEKAEFLYQN